MGFNANPTVYRLEFEDPQFEGLVVRIRHGSIQIRADFDKAVGWREQLEVFVRALVEWNLEDDEGKTLPFTVEALLGTQDNVVNAMLNAWVDAGRPPAPLEQPSTSGESSSAPPSDEAMRELESSLSMQSLTA
ncbi:hypothetical protein GCM10027258_62290 [Amycolatopsis stemonae]